MVGDFSGYIIDDIIEGGRFPYTIPSETIIIAKGFLVIYQSDSGIYLNNDGDTVNFIDEDGITIIDSYTYSSCSDDVSWGREIDGGSTWNWINTFHYWCI